MKSMEEEYKIIYARDLLTNLDYENVDERSDDDVIEACEIEGFYWDGPALMWRPEE